MGFPRQEYWSQLPFPSPGDLPDPGIEPTSPVLQADTLPLSHKESPLSNNIKWIFIIINRCMCFKKVNFTYEMRQNLKLCNDEILFFFGKLQNLEFGFILLLLLLFVRLFGLFSFIFLLNHPRVFKGFLTSNLEQCFFGSLSKKYKHWELLTPGYCYILHGIFKHVSIFLPGK